VKALAFRPALEAYARQLLHDPSEAEDVAQEAMLRLETAASPPDPSSLPGWLYAVTYHLSVDHLRARKKLERVLAERRPLAPSALRTEEVLRAEETLHRLPEPYRTAVGLRYIEGLGFPALAGRMGALERTARTWVGRGLSMLRERLKS